MFKQLNTKKLILLTTLGILCSATGCGNTDISGTSTEVSSSVAEATSTASASHGSLRWPKSELAALLPVPESTDGKTEYDYSDSFYLTVNNTSLDAFNTYIDKCYDNGFSVDYSRGEDYYYASDAAGNNLSLNYETGDIMEISLSAPYTYETEESSESVDPSGAAATQEAAVVDNSTQESAESKESSDEMRPEFKEAMDQYESFMNEYCDFMKKYASSDGTDLSLLADYANYMSKYADVQKAFDAWDGQTMNTAEAQYYIEVQSRVSQKLLSVQ